MAHARVEVMTTRTFERIRQAPEHHERLQELIHGEVVEKMPTEAHGKLAALVAYFLLAYVRPRGRCPADRIGHGCCHAASGR